MITKLDAFGNKQMCIALRHGAGYCPRFSLNRHAASSAEAHRVSLEIENLFKTDSAKHVYLEGPTGFLSEFGFAVRDATRVAKKVSGLGGYPVIVDFEGLDEVVRGIVLSEKVVISSSRDAREFRTQIRRIFGAAHVKWGFDMEAFVYKAVIYLESPSRLPA